MQKKPHNKPNAADEQIFLASLKVCRSLLIGNVVDSKQRLTAGKNLPDVVDEIYQSQVRSKVEAGNRNEIVAIC